MSNHSLRLLYGAICALVILACGGNGVVTSGTGWTLSGPGNVSFPTGSTGLVRLKLKGHDFTIAMRVKQAPAGWTVQVPTTPFQLSGLQDVEFDATVSIPPGYPLGNETIKFEGTQVGGVGDGSTVEYGLLVFVVNPGTGIRQVGSFSQTAGVHSSLLEITWNLTTPWSTLMNVRPNGFVLADSGGGNPRDGVIWYTPKSGGISLDPGDVEQVTVKVLPTTNRTGRTYNFTSYFGHTTREYGVDLSLAHPPAAGVSYTITDIDHQMGLRLIDPDKTSSYTIRFDGVTPGRYTFSTTNLPARYAAVVNPPFVDVTGVGTAEVQVVVTRVADGPLEEVEEFMLRATHSNNGGSNTQLTLPVQSWSGR